MKKRGLEQLNWWKKKFIYILLDDDGPYYWHIKSGTIQREPPEKKEASSQPAMNFQRQVVQNAEVDKLPYYLWFIEYLMFWIVSLL